MLTKITVCEDKFGWPGAALSNGTAELVPIFDCDNDGVIDSLDAFPRDSSETTDTDFDGIGNNLDSDDDGDGLSDTDEEVIGTDSLNPDSDGDGVSDGTDVFPLDASEAYDIDQDGIGDNADSDDYIQAVTGSLSKSEVIVGQTTSLTVSYRASDDAKLTGLGLRLHFDSSSLQMGDYAERLRESAQPFQIKDDTSDFDGDPNTDKYFLTSWADTSGDGWPYDAAQPVILYSVPLTAIGDFDGSSLNFSVSSLAAGYSLTGLSLIHI